MSIVPGSSIQGLITNLSLLLALFLIPPSLLQLIAPNKILFLGIFIGEICGAFIFYQFLCLMNWWMGEGWKL